MSIESLKGSFWGIKAARALLPIMIECAQQKRTIYYLEAKELLFAQGISRAHTPMYGRVAGRVGDALIELAQQEGCSPYPPLDILVICKKDNLPGSGVDCHLKRYLNIYELGEKRKQYIAQAQRNVFSFDGWDVVLKKVKSELNF